MTTHPLHGLLNRMRLHGPLGAGDATAVLALPFTVQTRDQSAHVVREGDTVEHCFVVLSGVVERHRIESSGGKQILAFYLPSDPLNLDHLFLDTADDDLCTLRPSVLAAIRLADLREAMVRHPGLATAVLRMLAVDASIFREWTVNVGQRDAEARIAHLLCELEVRRTGGAPTEGGEALALPVTQYNIAEATGLTAVHVNRTLKGMQAKGLLAAGRGGIRVHEWARMRALAGFDQRYLHIAAAELPH